MTYAPYRLDPRSASESDRNLNRIKSIAMTVSHDKIALPFDGDDASAEFLERVAPARNLENGTGQLCKSLSKD